MKKKLHCQYMEGRYSPFPPCKEKPWITINYLDEVFSELGATLTLCYKHTAEFGNEVWKAYWLEKKRGHTKKRIKEIFGK